jgi:dimethylglycine dehydrogenase
MHFPHIQWPAGRKAKTSPIYEALKTKNAAFGSYGGWERAEYFLTDGEEERMVDSYDRQPNFGAVGAECRHVAEHAGLLDLTGFSRFEVKGIGTRKWLDSLVTNHVPKEGRIGLIYFASEKGKVLTEMTATCFADDHFWLMTGAGALWHDRDWLNMHLPEDGSVEIKDITRDLGSLLLTGPKSPAIMEKLTDASMDQVSFPWLTHQMINLAGIDAIAIRVSFAGEAGWEIHADMGKLLDVWNAINDAGAEYNLGLFGMLALESMRLEKGYRSWKSDLTSDYSMLESGLGRWVNTNKDDFIGKAALQAEQQQGSKRRYVLMTLEDPKDGEPFGEAVYLSSIRHGDRDIGLILSSGYGHRIGKSIAYGVIDEDAFNSDMSSLTVNVLGRSRAATIVEGDVLYDSGNEKVRA